MAPFRTDRCLISAMIELRRVTKRYGPLTAVRDVSLERDGQTLSQSFRLPSGVPIAPLSAAMLFGAAYLVHRRRHGRASA